MSPSNPVWKNIEFDGWRRGDITISVNPFGEGPIILELEGNNGDYCTDNSEWMTPTAARELAAKLIEAADAADKAGLLSPVGSPGSAS